MHRAGMHSGPVLINHPGGSFHLRPDAFYISMLLPLYRVVLFIRLSSLLRLCGVFSVP